MCRSASGWSGALAVLCCALCLVANLPAVRGVSDPRDQLSLPPPRDRGPRRGLTAYLKAPVGRLVEADLAVILGKALGYQNVLGQGSASHLSFTCQSLPEWLILLQKDHSGGTAWTLQGVPAPLDLGRTLFSCRCLTCRPDPVSLTITLNVTLPHLLTAASAAGGDLGGKAHHDSSAPGEAYRAVNVSGDAASELSRVEEEEEGMGRDGPAETRQDPARPSVHVSSATATTTTQPCPWGNHVASLILSADPAALTSSQRVKVMRKAGEFLSLPAAALTWLTAHDQRLQMLEKGYKLEAGGALDSHPTPDGGGGDDSAQDEVGGGGLVTSELVWPLACAATRHLPEFLRVLQHNVGVGRVGRELGVAVLGWYVAVDQRLQPLSHGKRRRRRAAQHTPSPTPTLYPRSATPFPSRSTAPWRPPQVEMTQLARSPLALPSQLATLAPVDASAVETQATPATLDSFQTPGISLSFTLQPSDLEPLARSDALDLQILSSVGESWYLSETLAAFPLTEVPLAASRHTLWLEGQTPPLPASSPAWLELSTLSSELASFESLKTLVVATSSLVEAAPEVLPAVVDMDSVEQWTDHVTAALADLPSSRTTLPAQPLPPAPSLQVSHQVSQDLLTAELQPTGVVFHLQTPAISSEILDSSISGEILDSSISREILATYFSTQILALSISSEILALSISSEILAPSISSEVLASTAPSEILASTAPSEILAPSVSSDILAMSVPSEILTAIATSLPMHVLETSVTSEVLDASDSSEILLETLSSKIMAAPFSIELIATTVPSEKLPAAISTAILDTIVLSEILTTSIFHEIVPTAVASKIPTVAVSSEIQMTPVFEPTDYSTALAQGVKSVTASSAEVSRSIGFAVSVADVVLWTMQEDTAAPVTSAVLGTRDVFPRTSAALLPKTEEASWTLTLSPDVETVSTQASQADVQISTSDVSTSLTSVWAETVQVQDKYTTSSGLASQLVSRWPDGCAHAAATGAGFPDLSCVDDLAATTGELGLEASSVETLPAGPTLGTLAGGFFTVTPTVVHPLTSAWPPPEEAGVTTPSSASRTGLPDLVGESSVLPEAFTGGTIILPSLSTTVVAWPVAISVQPPPSASRTVDAVLDTGTDVIMTTAGDGVTVAAGFVSLTADAYDLTPTLSTEMVRETWLSQAETVAAPTSLISTSLSTTAVLMETAGPSSATVLPATATSPESGTAAVSPISTAVSAAETTQAPSSSSSSSSPESDSATPAAPTTAEPVDTSAGTSPSTKTLTSAAPPTVPAAITSATTATTSASTPSASSTEAVPSSSSAATSPTTDSTADEVSTPSASRPWWVTTPDETDVEMTSVAGSVDVPNNPPFLVHSLSYLTAHLGRCFRHPIPPEMFHDVEDGNTPHLTLTLTLPFDQPLPPNFWVQLDTGGQALIGLPLVADLDTGYHSVVLVATDSKGLGVRNPINLYVNSSAFTLFTHRFIMKFSVDFGQFMRRRDNIMSLLERLASFAGDVTTDHVTVVDVSIGSFVMSWTNSSLSGLSCPNDTIHELLYRMVRRDGAARSAFSRHLGKKLKLESLTYQPDGACLSRPALPPPSSSTSTPTPSSSPPGGKGEGGSSAHLLTDVILPVLIALLILLLLTVLLLFLYRCRQQRQASSLETLDKDLYTVDRTPVILPHEMPGVQAYSVRPKTPTLLPYDHRDPVLLAGGGGGGSFPRASHQSRPRSYQPYRHPGGAPLSRDRPNSYTFEGEVSPPHRLDTRPVTVIFNNFDSAPRRSRPPSYWNDHNEETPPNICVPPPYPKDLSNTTPV